MRVIQALMIHDIIGKPKIVLDQLREGLATLGFGTEMLQHPEEFEELFVHDNNVLESGSIIGSLQFPTVMSSDESTTHDYLIQFLQRGSQETLKRFLTFATGSPVLPEFGLGTIQVKFDDGTAIFCIHLSPKSDIAKEIPRQRHV